MPTFVASFANRFYAAKEANYGIGAAVDSGSRITAQELSFEQVTERTKRLDKTGSRTCVGTSTCGPRHSAFVMKTGLGKWTRSGAPAYGPFFESAMGASPAESLDLEIASIQNSNAFSTTVPHGLTVGTAVSFANEVRFVTAIPAPDQLVLNIPFSNALSTGTVLPRAITYRLSSAVPSVSIYDYWDPTNATDRVAVGAVVELMEVTATGDYHQLAFSGPASDVIDSASFQPGQGGFTEFPTEPILAPFVPGLVPGHLGRVWLGDSDESFALSGANIVLKNNFTLRNRDLGSALARGVVPGPRELMTNFSVLAQTDGQIKALYAAARQRTPLPVFLQLGYQQEQMMSIFIPAMTPEVPIYEDSGTCLEWQFRNNRAKGISDDEIYIAFS